MMCRVSIIIAIYNVEQYLKRCLDSVLSQTFTDFEAFLVNDGSTDGSETICKTYVQKDNRFQYIYQNNGGLSSARNTGLEHAKGEYICFLDADDWLEPSYLETLCYTKDKYRCDIVVCGYYLSSDVNLKEIKLTDRIYELKTKEFIHKVAVNEIQSFAWNKLYDRTFFKSHKFRVGKLFEDVLLLNEIMPEISSVCVIPDALYHYYMRDDSIVHKRNIKREQDYFNAFRERYELDYMCDDDKAEILKLLLIEYYYIIQTDYNEGIKYKSFIKNQNTNLLKRSLDKMSRIEKIRFRLSWFAPKIYRFICTLLTRGFR